MRCHLCIYNLNEKSRNTAAFRELGTFLTGTLNIFSTPVIKFDVILTVHRR